MARADLYYEIDRHLMVDDTPSEYLDSLLKKGLLGDYPFTMLSSLERIEQSSRHHPEGNVWNHTLLVVDQAALKRDKSSNKRVLMWSALLHDLGKVPATRIRKGKITAYDHDKLGAALAADFLGFFGEDQSFIKKVAAMVRWHMQILYVVKDLPFADIR
ncbi:MAG TPA: HD domain-containing protein, partial [Candidatus Atribacteria bacterium]|nr:HD domain-containing protein [Candidatus Atribacteria bacterium]